VSAPRSLLAGLGAGLTEAVFAVTPSETIKCVLLSPSPDQLKCTIRRTKLIDDAKRPQPRFRGLVHGTVSIVREEGLRGIYRGLFPVVRLVVWFRVFSPPVCVFAEPIRR
jgi:solute carrier family 25 citrate transporter 1